MALSLSLSPSIRAAGSPFVATRSVPAACAPSMPASSIQEMSA